MKVFVRLILAAAVWLTACAVPYILAQQLAPAGLSASPTPPTAEPPTPTTAPPAVIPPRSTPARAPTPTAVTLPTRVTREEPDPEPRRPREERRSLIEQYLPRAEVVAETEHFVFYAQDGYFPVDMDWWLESAETAYDYVSDRVQARGKSKVQLAFMPPETNACPVRGLAAQENPPSVLIYADENSSRDYLLAVLAHELGHAIPYEGFPGGLPDDTALTEGLATWASGRYWARWKRVSGLDALVRGYIREGTYEPLHENITMEGIYPWQNGASSAGAQGGEDECLARRDRLYTQWGAFLGYLIDTYGWEKAHRLFESPREEREGGRVISFPPDFQGVYGKALNQLEAEWLARLSRPARYDARLR